MADDAFLLTAQCCVLLYYITDRTQFPGDEGERRRRLLAKIAEAARCGVDYIQLREKDLPARQLEALARQAVRLVRDTRNGERETRLLINFRADVALASGAHGVHLPASDISPADVRAIWNRAAQDPAGHRRLATGDCLVAVSCHATAEARLAESQGADFAVFGPVFEKRGTSQQGVGLEALRAACQLVRMPVLALGGVTLENARACVEAGAAGVAGIRLFQENHAGSVVERLKDG